MRRPDISTARTVLLLVAVVISTTMALSCRSSGRDAERQPVVIRLPDGPPLDVEGIRFEPPGHVKALRLDEVRNLSIDTDGTALTAYLSGLCPVSIPAVAIPSAPVVALPLLRLEGAVAQVGYDARFELTAVLGCPDAGRGHIEWRQLEGPPLAEPAVLDGGRRFRARTLPRSQFLADPLPPGIVAVSPRTQGRYVVEAALSAGDLPPVHRTLTITSIARATGLSSLAVSQRVMLGGAGWHVEHAPRGGRAQVEDAGGTAVFAPDVAGRWILADAAGTRMGVQALTHDRTPLDCGRADCHATIAIAASTTPMSEALQRPLRSGSTPSCDLDCHVVGERSLHDGGFFDVREALGFRSPRGASFERMPHALQRLGGVRCTSCHGPGAIPEPGDRARILRASVCATCHDAPPSYTHVDRWSRSAMARADRAAEARKTPACARCHTTGGFLDAIGVRRRGDASRDPDGAVVGISCAACHAVHGAHVGALVRAVDRPASLDSEAVARVETSGSVCTICHSPAPEETLPSASSAVLVEGRLRFPAALGAAEESGPAPHAGLPNGCVGCHGASPGKSGTDHSFAVDATTCATCHPRGAPTETPDASGRTLNQRATELVTKLRRECGTSGAVETPHARPGDAASCRLAPERARAFYAAALVSEDRAAAVHNARFARSLLDRAESIVLGPR